MNKKVLRKIKKKVEKKVENKVSLLAEIKVWEWVVSMVAIIVFLTVVI